MSRIWLTSMVIGGLGAPMFLTGCGGGGGWYYGEDWDYPEYHYVTLYLRVQEPDGSPLRGAKVTIAGEEVDGLTAGRWYRIGEEAPPEWRGWQYNWAVEDYQVRINREGQVRRLTVRVAKEGWGSDSTEIVVEDDDPTYIYVRIVFTLGVGSTEVMSSAAPEYLRPVESAINLRKR
jgi:hypothetical protein